VTTTRLREVLGGPPHPFCNTNVVVTFPTRLRDISGDPVHPFCNTNVVEGVSG
jgi:hypothetical protein